MDIKIVDEKGLVVNETPISSDPGGLSGQPGEFDRLNIANLFDIESTQVGKYSKKIDTLLDWAKQQTDNHDMMNLKWVIKNLEAKLGSPNFGEKRIDKIHRYAYLDMEGKRLEAEKVSLTK
jgi:hypothetical protein